MYENPIRYLLLRDLQVCVGITFVAMVLVALVALPMACTEYHSKYLKPFSQRFMLIWVVGSVHLAVSSIVLCAALYQFYGFAESQHWIGTEQSASVVDLIVMPFLVGYIFCVAVALRMMWRTTQTPPGKPSRTFSLKELLVVQFVLLFLCGLWVVARRGEIGRLNHMRKVIFEDAPR
ncbi:hypothetical protein [Anatilimnocola floriformis]|uniref:hypothetical protein n=1 Tax=Anatilimnocola floriformis TaxID=2948575 RepID=UPI0020C4A81C|nr:hypothetical protein [Anatilimnocola floriformis]